MLVSIPNIVTDDFEVHIKLIPNIDDVEVHVNITSPCCRNDVEWSNNFVTCMLRQMLQQPDDTKRTLLTTCWSTLLATLLRA